MDGPMKDFIYMWGFKNGCPPIYKIGKSTTGFACEKYVTEEKKTPNIASHGVLNIIPDSPGKARSVRSPAEESASTVSFHTQVPSYSSASSMILGSASCTSFDEMVCGSQSVSPQPPSRTGNYQEKQYFSSLGQRDCCIMCQPHTELQNRVMALEERMAILENLLAAHTIGNKTSWIFQVLPPVFFFFDCSKLILLPPGLCCFQKCDALRSFLFFLMNKLYHHLYWKEILLRKLESFWLTAKFHCAPGNAISHDLHYGKLVMCQTDWKLFYHPHIKTAEHSSSSDIPWLLQSPSLQINNKYMYVGMHPLDMPDNDWQRALSKMASAWRHLE